MYNKNNENNNNNYYNNKNNKIIIKTGRSRYSGDLIDLRWVYEWYYNE